MMKENEKELSNLIDKACDLNAKLSAKELHQIDFLLGSEQEDESVTQLIRQDWEEKYKGFDEMNYERIFDRVKQRIRTHNGKRLSFIQFLYRCAAVLLLPLLGLSIYLFIQTNTLNRPVNLEEIVETLEPPVMQSKITLSDGSVVTLKDGSRLNLKNNFSGNTREVILDGEAFFDIARNPNKPFIIHTGRIRTTVLGTSFSIKAMSGDSTITVTVAEGKVKVEDGSKLLATLGANQQFIHGIEDYHSQEKTSGVEQEKIPEVEIDLRTHELIFSNMSFGDITQELAGRYGVNIVVENETLKRQRTNALLDNRNSIDALLEFLCASQQATYTVEGKTYVIK